jgi:hypothetical protein
MQTLHQTARVGIALAFLLIVFAPLRSVLADEGVPFSKNLSLTNAQLSVDQGPSVVTAFILTNSADPNCLVTLGESNNAGAGVVAFCGVRTPSLYGGKPGVLVTVFFPAPVVGNLILTLTIHQNGAHRYAQPVACSTADGC